MTRSGGPKPSFTPFHSLSVTSGLAGGMILRIALRRSAVDPADDRVDLLVGERHVVLELLDADAAVDVPRRHLARRHALLDRAGPGTRFLERDRATSARSSSADGTPGTSPGKSARRPWRTSPVFRCVGCPRRRRERHYRRAACATPARTIPPSQPAKKHEGLHCSISNLNGPPKAPSKQVYASGRPAPVQTRLRRNHGENCTDSGSLSCNRLQLCFDSCPGCTARHPSATGRRPWRNSPSLSLDRRRHSASRTNTSLRTARDDFRVAREPAVAANGHEDTKPR